MSDKEAGKHLISSAYQARAIVAGLERYSALPDDYPGDAVQEAIIAAIATARPHILEEAARIADKGALVPPDGGAPTPEENAVAEHIAAAIRAAKENEE